MTKPISLFCLLAATACSSNTGAFECRGDGQCRLDSFDGFCEPNGFCSFSDLSCDSGRRYSSLSGEVANICVPVEQAGSGSSGDPLPGSLTTSLTGTSTAGELGTFSTTEQTSTTLVPTLGSTAGSTTTGSSAEASSSSSTTDEPSGCVIVFEDEFDGSTVDPAWNFIANGAWPRTLSDSQLIYSVGTHSAYTGLRMAVPAAYTGTFSVTVTDVPNQGQQQQLAMGIFGPGQEFYEDRHYLHIAGNGELQFGTVESGLFDVDNHNPGALTAVELSITVTTENTVEYAFRPLDGEWTVLDERPRAFTQAGSQFFITVGNSASTAEADDVAIGRAIMCQYD